MSNEYEANLAEELTLENIVSECEKCNGSGVLILSSDWQEIVEECECLRKYHDLY